MKSKTFFKSKSNQNLVNFRKKNKLSLKYSNAVLFEKREELLLLKEKQSKNYQKRNAKIFQIIKSNYQTDNSNKNIFSQKHYFNIKSVPYLSPSNTTRNYYLKKSPSYTVNNKKIPKLFLTEEALLQKNIIKKSEIKSPSQKNILKTDLENIYNNENATNNNLNFLLTIQKDLKEYRERNKENNDINIKIRKLNKKEKSRRTMVKKLNEFKFLNFMVYLKKEREKNKKEEKENEVEFIQEKIHSINKAIKLLGIQFMNRISDYLRYLETKINSEKTENINLLKEKMKIKREIIQLNSEIEKIKEKREGILRWIYLQMKVKEKKLTLPKYYKKIFEATKAEILYMQTKFDDNLQQINVKRERDDKLRAQKLKKNFMKKKTIKEDHIFSSPSKKTKNIFNYQSEKSVFHINKKPLNLNYNSPPKKEEHKEMNKIKIFLGDDISKSKSGDKEGELLTKEEFDKIIFWKFRPIFQSPEEFMDSLNYLDLKNIKLLEYYNQLQFKNYCLKQELVQIRNSKEKFDFNIDEQLAQKTAELEKIRNKHIMILKTHEKINETKKINKNKKDNDSETKSFDDSEMNTIYNKLSNIFDDCKIVNNKELTELIYYYIKSEKTKEGEMIYLIEYIECTLDFLIGKISLYKMNDDLNEKVHELEVEIDKQHKREKPNKQKLEDKQKHLNLIKKVMKKSEQQYIIPTRHIDLVRYNVRELGKPKKRKKINKDDFPNLDDFMQNPNIINDNYNNNYEKYND